MLQSIKKYVVYVAAVLCLLVSVVTPTYAVTTTQPGGTVDQLKTQYGISTATIAGSGDIKAVIQGVINFFLLLLGIIAVIIIMISGWQWMTADSEDKVKEARKRLINSVIGLIIIFAAYAIVYVVFNTIAVEFLATPAATP